MSAEQYFQMPGEQQPENSMLDQVLADKREEQLASITEALPQTTQEKLELTKNATAAVMTLRTYELPPEAHEMLRDAA